MVVVDEDGVLARWADWQARSKQVPVGAIADDRGACCPRNCSDNRQLLRRKAAVCGLFLLLGQARDTSSRFLRAAFSVTSGNVPRDIRFSFPPKRNFNRHHLPPAGETSR